MDIIFIKKLTIFTKIGMYDWEKIFLQKLIFDLKLGFKSLSKDRIDEKNLKNVSFIDYTSVSNMIYELVNEKRYILVEQLAEDIARKLIENFKILWIQIKICKPSAIPQAKNVGILIERWREEKDVILTSEF